MSDTIITPEIPTADLAAWLGEQTWSSFAMDLARYYARNGRLSDRQEASARSMYAKVAARQAARQAAPVAEVAEPVGEGFYVVDDTLYKVVTAGHGGRYAMRRGDAGGWQYARGVIRTITDDQRVTPEQAVAYGLRTGICMFCNAELDDREGLGAIVGVGPSCSRQHLGLTQRQLAERMGIDVAAARAEAEARRAAAAEISEDLI